MLCIIVSANKPQHDAGRQVCEFVISAEEDTAEAGRGMSMISCIFPEVRRQDNTSCGSGARSSYIPARPALFTASGETCHNPVGLEVHNHSMQIPILTD